MNVESFLEESSRRHPGKTALVCGSGRYTYRDVESRSRGLAHALIAAGVGRGDRVAILLDNSLASVVAIFAALEAGAAFVVLNPTTKGEKLRFLLRDMGARALVTGSAQLAGLDPPLSEETAPPMVALFGQSAAPLLSGVASVLPADRAMEGGPSPPPPKRHGDEDLAALIYTSGSTANPKAVMLTHRNITAAADSITGYLENVSSDVILNVLPLSFDYGLYQVLTGFKTGATVVLGRSFAYPEAVLRSLAAEKATGFPIVPMMAAILTQKDLSRHDLRSLRYITSTAAPLPVNHIMALRKALPHVRLFSMYGLTECKRVSFLAPEEVERRPASVGKAIPNTEAYVVDECGRRAPPGIVGELVVRGAHVMKGYWGRPEETDAVLRPGPCPGEKVLYTGDLFRTDEDGYLYFVGRRDDIIKSRGEKVSPREIEEVLCSMDGIAEAAVVGVTDDILGMAIKAVVVPRTGIEVSETDVRRHCARRLEDCMQPKYVEIRESLPRTESGKVDRRRLSGGEAP